MEIHQDEGLAAGLILAGYRVEARRVDYREGGLVLDQVFRFRLDEQVACEQAVPGVFRDDADRHAIVGIGPRETVLHIDVLHLQV